MSSCFETNCQSQQQVDRDKQAKEAHKIETKEETAGKEVFKIR